MPQVILLHIYSVIKMKPSKGAHLTMRTCICFNPWLLAVTQHDSLY